MPDVKLPGSSWTSCLRAFSLFSESSIFDISTNTEYISRVKRGSGWIKAGNTYFKDLGPFSQKILRKLN